MRRILDGQTTRSLRRPDLLLRSRQASELFGQVRLEIPAHHVEDLDQRLVAQGVENLIAFLAVGDDLPAAQNCKMLRKVGLLDAQPLLDGARGDLAVRNVSTIAMRVGCASA